MIWGVVGCVRTQFSVQKCRVEEAVNMSHYMIISAAKETEYKIENPKNRTTGMMRNVRKKGGQEN